MPVRNGNIGGFGNDCELIGGNIVGGKRPSIGTSCDEEGGGIFPGSGLSKIWGKKIYYEINRSSYDRGKLGNIGPSLVYRRCASITFLIDLIRIKVCYHLTY